MAEMVNVRSLSHIGERHRDPSAQLRLKKAQYFLKRRSVKAIHQIGAIMRSGEYPPREAALGPPSAAAGAQPLPHNPRKQRKNPGAVRWRERFRGGKWRRDRDSNPGDGFPPTRVPGVRLRPLGHLSVGFSLTPCIPAIQALSDA